MAELLLVLGQVSKEVRAAIERQLGAQWPKVVKEFGRGAFIEMLKDAPERMLGGHVAHRRGTVEATFDLSRIDADYLEQHYDLPASTTTVVVLETELYEVWCLGDPALLMSRFPQAVGIFVARGGAQLARIK